MPLQETDAVLKDLNLIVSLFAHLAMLEHFDALSEQVLPVRLFFFLFISLFLAN